MSPRSRVVGLAALLVVGCTGRRDVQCTADTDCDLSERGICTPAASGNQWCAYPDLGCPEGYRYSDQSVGDDLSGVCIEDATFSLTVQLGGKGSGSIASEPAALVCSTETCTGRFRKGDVVQLSATAATGSFIGWTHLCRGQGSCTVAMDSNRSVGALFGSPGEALWAKQVGGDGLDHGADIAIDSEGNLVIVGTFSETMTLDSSTSVKSDGGRDVYVIKLAGSTADVIWARRLGGVTDEGYSGVSIDQLGKIYVAGSFQGTMTVGDRVLQARGASDLFVVQFQADGQLGWTQQIRSTGFIVPLDISVGDDLIVVGGSYTGTLTADTAMGQTTFTSAGAADIFALGISASGSAIKWLKSFGGSSNDSAYSTAVDRNNDVVITGDFSNSVNFGVATFSTGGANIDQMFLLKLSAADGRVLFAKQFGTTAIEAGGRGIALASTNEIVATGHYYGAIDFGCAAKPVDAPPGKTNAFLVKLSQAGACEWSKGFEGTGNHRLGLAVAVNAADDIAFSGGFCGTISLGGQTLTSASVCNTTDMFAARFDSDGVHLNSVRGGGMGTEDGAGIAQALDGRFFVTGAFDSNLAEFGDESFVRKGISDAFIIGFAPL